MVSNDERNNTRGALQKKNIFADEPLGDGNNQKFLFLLTYEEARPNELERKRTRHGEKRLTGAREENLNKIIKVIYHSSKQRADERATELHEDRE